MAVLCGMTERNSLAKCKRKYSCEKLELVIQLGLEGKLALNKLPAFYFSKCDLGLFGRGDFFGFVINLKKN